jgi:hypothetical protein
MAQLSDLLFFNMRQALVEARLITDKHACDAIYVVTLLEELRDIEARITALEKPDSLTPGSGSNTVASAPLPESLPDAQSIQSRACELEARLQRIQSSLVQTTDSASEGDSRANVPRRAVPRYK